MINIRFSCFVSWSFKYFNCDCAHSRWMENISLCRICRTFLRQNSRIMFVLLIGEGLFVYHWGFIVLFFWKISEKCFLQVVSIFLYRITMNIFETLTWVEIFFICLYFCDFIRETNMHNWLYMDQMNQLFDRRLLVLCHRIDRLESDKS